MKATESSPLGLYSKRKGELQMYISSWFLGNCYASSCCNCSVFIDCLPEPCTTRPDVWHVFSNDAWSSEVRLFPGKLFWQNRCYWSKVCVYLYIDSIVQIWDLGLQPNAQSVYHLNQHTCCPSYVVLCNFPHRPVYVKLLIRGFMISKLKPIWTTLGSYCNSSVMSVKPSDHNN